jgi:trk system potassium uptake protein TrkH
MTIPWLIILGGIGYMVIIELYSLRKDRILRLSTNTKIILLMTALLIFIGMALLLSLEWNNAFKTLSWEDKILASWFTSVNYRTAGFNTIDLSTLTSSDLFFGTFFMMIGGAPGGTAGGLKVTVVALAFIGVWYTLRGDERAHIFRRSISDFQISKAYAIIFVASMYVVTSTVLLSEFEKTPFLPTLFEACSAFGTVGISTGNGGVLSLSALFGIWGKINIIFLMFMGRIGVFAFTVIIIGKATQSRVQYPEAKVIL